jgi:hypothetical protein
VARSFFGLYVLRTFFLSLSRLTGVANKDDLGTFNADDVRSVQTADGKYVVLSHQGLILMLCKRIIAVGAMACSSDQLKKNGPQGQALFVLHLIDDQLW